MKKNEKKVLVKVITAKLLNELYELENKYDVNEYFELSGVGLIEEQYKEMMIKQALLSGNDKKKLMDYYCNYYAIVEGIDIDKVYDLDYSEVKKAVITFRAKN